MLRDEIREWLQSKHCSLWADFCIQTDDGLEAAVDWWMSQLAAYHMFQMDNRRQVAARFGAFDVVSDVA